jgi:squalene-hopene/tetraprenyl-beta-curcumene cyclase
MLLVRRQLSLSFLFACALLAFGRLATAEEKPLFEDLFAGKLAAGWTWIEEVPGSWKVDKDSLDLQVVPVGDGIWMGGKKHPNLLVRDPGTKDDYAVEVQLTSKPTGQFEHAGIILYVDGDNYVVINKEMTSKQEVVFVSEKAGKPAVRQAEHEHDEICLRLAVTGKKVTAQHRHYDSDPWIDLGELELPVAGPYKVGVFAGRPPKDADHHVQFSKFRILPVSVGSKVASSKASKDAESAAPAQPKRPIRTDVSLAVQARETAERAIPYIAKDGTKWITERKCLSCHYSGYMLWSFRDASQRGFKIDQEKLVETTKWSLEQTKGHGAEGMAQTLIARTLPDKNEDTVKLAAAFRDQICKEQNAKGFWNAGGQLPGQKRPLNETMQVSTMICVLGLATFDKLDEKATESCKKAIEWLKATPPNGDKPALSTEWYALKLVIEKRFGDAKEADALRAKLLAAQREDGGWGWLTADPSDAYGTGVAIYALAEAGVPSTNPAIERAWKFLIETQTDEGKWIVNGTKTANKDKPHPMSSFWGTTWALLGLSKTIPDSAMVVAASHGKSSGVVANVESKKP